SLGREERPAEVRLAAETELAVATFRDVERDHVIAGGERRDPGADVLDDPAALVAEHGREEPRGVAAAQRVGVGVADARRDQPDEALSGPRWGEVDFVDRERLPGRPGDRA